MKTVEKKRRPGSAVPSALFLQRQANGLPLRAGTAPFLSNRWFTLQRKPSNLIARKKRNRFYLWYLRKKNVSDDVLARTSHYQSFLILSKGDPKISLYACRHYHRYLYDVYGANPGEEPIQFIERMSEYDRLKYFYQEAINQISLEKEAEKAEKRRLDVIANAYRIEEKEPYSKATNKSNFTGDEKKWINEVMSSPDIYNIIKTFSKIPKIVLYKVKNLYGAYGQSDEYKIALDETYPKKTIDYDVQQSREEEEKFKALLIHELFHFFFKNIKDEYAKGAIPSDLLKSLLYPDLGGYDNLGLKAGDYAFGWFEYYDSIEEEKRYWNLGFGDYGACGMDCSPKYKKAKEKSNSIWECCTEIEEPLPTEDLAETFRLYCTSESSKNYLKNRYPKRYKLMDKYFQQLSILN